MGKKKSKKFGAAKPHPAGLLPTFVDENELMNSSSSTIVADVLEQLQSVKESTRECGCRRVADLAAQAGVLPILRSNNVVRILAPLVIDPCPYVRHQALVALRNMTVDGGIDLCQEMVLKDVLTPLVALFKEYGTNWEPVKSEVKHIDVRLDTFTQAVHVLWNLCEASDVAVVMFNKENLLPLLLPCLQHSVFGYPLAIVAAQCLQTVTEGSAEVAKMCRGDDVLPLLNSLTSGTDTSSQAALFQAALMGILMDVLGGELVNSPSLLAFVLTLGEIMDIDGTTLIANYTAKKPQENGGPQTCASGDADHQSLTLGEEDAFPSDSDFDDINNTLDAQCLCLELAADMCCSPEEAWEEIDSSESGSSDELMGGVDMDQEVATDNNNFDTICTASEVQAAFVTNKIMAKVVRLSLPLPAEVEASVQSKKWDKKILKKLTHLRTHALLCINNMMEVLPLEGLGGTETLHQLWDTLAMQVKGTGSAEGAGCSPIPQPIDPDLLEATTSAMRAVVQKLAHLDSPKFAEVTVADVQFLVKLAEGAASCVQIHVMRIVATIAQLLVKTTPLHAVVQEVGGCLLMAAMHSPDLVVVAEALDSLFDVFAEDDTDPVAQNLQLTEKLRAIIPQLKVKLQSQKKALGENYITVSTARTNLIRFIKYKDSQGQH